MAKFGFSQEEMDDMRDQPIDLEGTKDVGIVLFHGWSSFPRELKEIAYYLHKQGYWVYVPMLKGHGTFPEDLENVSWKDWLKDADQAILRMKNNQQLNKIILGGASMGGSLALLASQKSLVDGIFLIGTPVHLKNHFAIWLSTFIPSWIKRYQKKSYPRRLQKEKELYGYHSYRYFPLKSVSDCLAIIRKAIFSLWKVTAPLLILQTNSDYLVTKYSPWVIYNAVSSTKKKMHWLKSESGSHVMVSEKVPDFFPAIVNFINEIEKG